MFSVANEPKYVAFNCVYSHSITRVKFHPSFLEVQLGVRLIHMGYRHLFRFFFCFFCIIVISAVYSETFKAYYICIEIINERRITRPSYYCISRCSLILFEDKDVF